tara:strand:+ start:63 stop:575 length:513 start_codon:yes stop_codon:yes gene_type:complete
MAQQSLIPGKLGQKLGEIHTSFATPAVSISILGIFAGTMALSGSFVWLAISSVLARLVVYAVCVVVLMKAQRASLQRAPLQETSLQSAYSQCSMQQDNSENDAYFNGSAGAFASPVNLFRRLIPFVALGVCAWSIAQSSTNAWLFLLGELVVGALLYFFYFAPSNKESKG